MTLCIALRFQSRVAFLILNLAHLNLPVLQCTGRDQSCKLCSSLFPSSANFGLGIRFLIIFPRKCYSLQLQMHDRSLAARSSRYSCNLASLSTPALACNRHEKTLVRPVMQRSRSSKGLPRGNSLSSSVRPELQSVVVAAAQSDEPQSITRMSSAAGLETEGQVRESENSALLGPDAQQSLRKTRRAPFAGLEPSWELFAIGAGKALALRIFHFVCAQEWSLLSALLSVCW